jgi:arylsulfatase A-like enzyme
VPFIARWPGRIAAGTVSDHISAFWDFLPTACELAGVRAPQVTDGISIVPTLLGKRKSQAEHEYLYWEFPDRNSQAVRAGRWKAARLNRGKKRDGQIELYDLETDPAEERNVAESHPGIAARMAAYMAAAHSEPL